MTKKEAARSAKQSEKTRSAGRGPVPPPAPDHVLEYHECSHRLHCSLRTWARILAEGQGPPVIEISANRRGVFESDFYAWLATRRRYARGSVVPQPAAVEEAPKPKLPRGRPRKQLPAAAAE
jgi:hypothetical protein